MTIVLANYVHANNNASTSKPQVTLIAESIGYSVTALLLYGPRITFDLLITNFFLQDAFSLFIYKNN